MLMSVGFAAMLAALARIAMSAHFAGPEIARGASALLAALGTASMIVGSVQAIGAQDLRRLAAYACAAQAGAVALSVAFISPAGAAAALLHVAVLTLAALGILGGAAMLDGRAPLASIDGMGRQAPIAGAAIAASALSLVGAPLSLGFVSRWRLVESALEAGWWWAAGALIAASLAAVIYVGRLVERLYLRSAAAPRARGARTLLLAPAQVVVIAATIGLGLDASALWRVAFAAGEALLRAP
jgi:multicomponent Na+:H+ antiporter subunit D